MGEITNSASGRSLSRASVSAALPQELQSFHENQSLSIAHSGKSIELAGLHGTHPTHPAHSSREATTTAQQQRQHQLLIKRQALAKALKAKVASAKAFQQQRAADKNTPVPSKHEEGHEAQLYQLYLEQAELGCTPEHYPEAQVLAAQRTQKTLQAIHEEVGGDEVHSAKEILLANAAEDDGLAPYRPNTSYKEAVLRGDIGAAALQQGLFLNKKITEREKKLAKNYPQVAQFCEGKSHAEIVEKLQALKQGGHLSAEDIQLREGLSRWLDIAVMKRKLANLRLLHNLPSNRLLRFIDYCNKIEDRAPRFAAFLGVFVTMLGGNAGEGMPARPADKGDQQDAKNRKEKKEAKAALKAEKKADTANVSTPSVTQNDNPKQGREQAQKRMDERIETEREESEWIAEGGVSGG